MSLDNKIKNWFEEQGYPLEMKVASLLRDSKLRVTQSGFYIDPETNNSREIDIVASQSTFVKEFEYFFNVSFLIECKSSKDKPWILMKYPREKHGDEIFDSASWRINDDVAGYYLLDLAAREKIFDVPFLNLEDHIGYGLTQAFTNNVDIPYKAVMSCLKASIGKKIEAEQNPFFKKAHICFPVIVLEGKLFEAILDQKGSININEIEEGTLYWNDKIKDEEGLTGVRIITKQKLADFKKEVIETAKHLTNDFEKRLPKIYSEIEKHVFNSNQSAT